jgi:hypothetical protein
LTIGFSRHQGRYPVDYSNASATFLPHAQSQV